MLKPQKFDKNGLISKEIRIPSPCVLYRDSIMEPYEKKTMNRYFVSTDSRMLVHGGDLVIGRYSVLPYYKELENDLKQEGVKLINSYSEHRYVADLQNYIQDLEDLTPRTWNFRDITQVPDNIPLIVKGETNSRKDKWKTHMFAKNKQEAIEVYSRLQDDSLIAQQEIYLREYVPLASLIQDNINGQPITLEFRFFVCYGEILSGGFYWSSDVDELDIIPQVSCVPKEFLQSAINKVKENVSFFVIDVAKTESGNWIVVELNDGQCSGLSENNPEELYSNLKNITWDRYHK